MKDLRRREELIRQFCHLRPYQSCSLATPTELPMPKNCDVMSERGQRQAIGRHGVIGEIASDDLSKPFPCFRDGPVCSSLQRFLDFPELRTHAVLS